MAQIARNAVFWHQKANSPGKTIYVTDCASVWDHSNHGDYVAEWILEECAVP